MKRRVKKGTGVRFVKRKTQKGTGGLLLVCDESENQGNQRVNLQPPLKHMPVEEYIEPEKFAQYEKVALAKGFKHVESSPLVRSSYHAEKHINRK